MARWITGISLQKVNQIKGAKDIIKVFRESFPELTRRKTADKTKLNQNFQLILCNFVYSVFERENLIIPNKSKEYERDGKLYKLHLNKGTTREILGALESHKYITKLKGNSYQKLANEYKPLSKLVSKVEPLIYSVQEEYISSKPQNYVTIKERSIKEKARKAKTRTTSTNRTYTKYIRGASSMPYRMDHPDVIKLHKINTYLSNVSYALKAPIRLIYTGDFMHGGRLYTPIQNLPNRKLKVRINTHINNEPVCEIDLVANHPSIAMALEGKKLPKDFYQIVSEGTKVEYDLLKDYVRKAMGADSRRIRLSKGMSKFDTARIDEFMQLKFPEIFNEMYKGRGAVFQSAEGQILMNAMISLIDQDIPSLPIHDALMVPQRFKNEGKDALQKAWMEYFPVKFKPHIDIEIPKKSQ